jgi:hypothetical protein
MENGPALQYGPFGFSASVQCPFSIRTASGSQILLAPYVVRLRALRTTWDGRLNPNAGKIAEIGSECARQKRHRCRDCGFSAFFFRWYGTRRRQGVARYMCSIAHGCSFLPKPKRAKSVLENTQPMPVWRIFL